MLTFRTFVIAVTSLTAGIILGACLTVAGQANAEVIQSQCDDLWMHSDQMTDPVAVEDMCRDRGWRIGWRYNLSPNGNRMWTGVKPCANDEIVPGESCYWNARTMGNHRGHSFVHLGHLGVFTGLHHINGHRS